MVRKNVLCLVYFYIAAFSSNIKRITVDKLFKMDRA